MQSSPCHEAIVFLDHDIFGLNSLEIIIIQFQFLHSFLPFLQDDTYKYHVPSLSEIFDLNPFLLRFQHILGPFSKNSIFHEEFIFLPLVSDSLQLIPVEQQCAKCLYNN